MADPLIFNNSIFKINFTIIFTIIATCLTIIRIFTKKPNKEQLPGQSMHCKIELKEIERIQKTTEANQLLIDNLKTTISKLTTQVAVLATRTEVSGQELDKLKLRLDDLLKQLLEYANT